MNEIFIINLEDIHNIYIVCLGVTKKRSLSILKINQLRFCHYMIIFRLNS